MAGCCWQPEQGTSIMQILLNTFIGLVALSSLPKTLARDKLLITGSHTFFLPEGVRFQGDDNARPMVSGRTLKADGLPVPTAPPVVPEPSTPSPSQFSYVTPAPSTSTPVPGPASPAPAPVNCNSIGTVAGQGPANGCHGSDGLGAAAIAGIVVGSVGGVMILAGAVLLLFVYQKKQKQKYRFSEDVPKQVEEIPLPPPRRVDNRIVHDTDLPLDKVLGAASNSYGQIGDYVSSIMRASVLNLDRLQRNGARGHQGVRAVLESLVATVLFETSDSPDFGVKSMQVPPMDSAQRTRFFKALFESVDSTEKDSPGAELAAYQSERSQALKTAAAQALDVPIGTAHGLLFGSRDLVRDFSAAARAAFALHVAAFALTVPAVKRTAVAGQPIDARLFRSSSPDDATVGFMIFPAFELDRYTVSQGTVFGVAARG